jgi:hypothetical protein
MSRILFRRSPNGQLYPQAFRSNFMGTIVYDPSAALAKDRDLPAKLLQDPIVMQAYDHRTRAVAQKSWRLKPASEDPADVALAKVLEFLIRKCGHLTRSLRQLAGAFLWGATYAQMRGQVSMLKVPGSNAAMNWWHLTSLEDVDFRMFRREVRRDSAGKAMRLVWTMATTDPRHGNMWVEGDGQEGRWDPAHFVKHKYDARHSDLGYGAGLVESIYWYHYAKSIAMREGLQGLERWAQGWVVLKAMRDAPADPDEPNTVFVTNAIQELETHLGRHVMVIDKDDEINVQDGPSTGWEQVKWWIEYLDGALTRALSGSLLPLGGGSDVGSNARGKVEQDTNDMVSQGDQEDLAETLTADVVPLMRDVNASGLGALGLGDAQLPAWEFLEDVVQNPAENAPVLQTAASLGLPLDRDDAYQKLNLKPPKDAESTLVLTPPMLPGAGGFGEGGAR